MKKNVFSLIVIFGMLLLLIVPVAATETYPNFDKGTYDMTGGIFYKKEFSSGTNMRITVIPTKGSYDCNMGIYTAHSSLFGWSGADYINSVSSVNKSESKYITTEAIDGIYFRNWSATQWTGSFLIEW